MNTTARVAAFALCAGILMGGCTTLPSLRGADDPQLERWLNDRSYGKALAELQRRPQTAETRARLRQVRERANAYDRSTAEAVRERYRNGQWRSALNLLDRALFRYPDGKALKRARADLRKQQKLRIEALDRELLLARGRFLAEAIPVYRELAEADPENVTRGLKLESAQSEAENIGRTLGRRGVRLLDEGQLAEAQRHLALAQELIPSDQVKQAWGRLQTIRQEQTRARERAAREAREKRRQKALAAQQRQRRQEQIVRDRLRADRLEEIETQLREALAGGELRQARDLLLEYEELAPDTPEAIQLAGAVEQSVNDRVNRLLEAGNRHYTAGRIAEAKATWEEALEIAPEHARLQSLVARADRVLRNLRDLRRRSSQEAEKTLDNGVGEPDNGR